MINSSNGFVLGSRISSGEENISVTCDAGATFVGRGNGYVKILTTTNINKKYRIKVTESNIEKDGVVINKTTNKFGEGVGNYNIRLFDCNQNGQSYRTFKGKIYYCKIWDNGELVREFIPCKRNDDNVLGMYDIVNNVFYVNSGSGNFVGGQEEKVSPNYPSKIETVGSNVNEFNKDTATLGGRIGLDGQFYNDTNYATSDYISVFPNSIYTINYDASAYHRTGYYDINKQFISGNTTNTTFTVPNNCYFIRLSMDKDFIDNVKLEKGTKATSYSPYNMGSVEIKKQTQFFNINKWINNNFTVIGGELITKDENEIVLNSTTTDCYTNTGASSKNPENNRQLYNKFGIDILPNEDYTIYCKKGAGSGNIYVFFLDKDFNYISNKNLSKTEEKLILNFTTPENAEHITIRIGLRAVMQQTFSNIMLLKGTYNENTIPEYVAYTEQTNIMPIQQEMLEGDYIEDIEHHEWNKIILSGQDDWNYNFYQEKENTIYFVLDGQANSGVTAEQIAEAICNRLNTVYTANTLWNNDNEGFALQENSLRVRIDKSRILNWNSSGTNSEKNILLRTYLKENNYIFYYKLATSLDLELTQAQKEAKEIQFSTYVGKTYISNDSNAILEVNYGKEIIPLGNFIIPKPDTEEVKEKTNFIGYDYMIKFNAQYKNRVLYPISAGELLEDICNQVGLEAGNTNFVNSDYMILGNPFTNNEDCRTVLSNIAQLAGGFARIGRDNKVYIISLKNIIQESVDGNNYFTDFSKNNEWGEVNSLIIRISGTEGENTVIQDEESVAQNGLTEIVIEDNYFLINQTEREKVITQLWNSLKGLKYLPINTEYYGYPYLDSGDCISITDSKDNVYSTYVFSHKFKYNGGYGGKIETSAMTKTQTAYKNIISNKTKFLQVERKIDKINGIIEDVIEEQTDFSNKLNKTTKSVDGIIEEVHRLYDFYKEIDGTNEIILEDALPTSIVELKIQPSLVENILYPQTTLYPADNVYPHKAGDGVTVVFGARSRVVSDESIYPNPTQYPSNELIPIGDSTTKTFSFYFREPLRIYNNVCDEFQITFNEETGICEAKVIRKISYNDGIYTIYTTPQEEVLGEVMMELFKGNNYVYLAEYTDWYIYAKYIFNNELNKEFAPRVESKSEIRKTADAINLEVSKKVNQDEVIASINLSPEQIKILAKNLQLEGFTSINGNFTIDEYGNMTCNDAKINGAVIANGEKFSVDEDGNVICKSATMENVVCENFIIKNSTIQEGYIELKSTEGNSSFSVIDTSTNRLNSELSANLLNFNSNIDRGVAQIGVDMASGNGFVSVEGNVYANNIASDKRLKENITDSKINAIETIKKIRIKSFDWKENKEHIEAGLIAQDLEKISERFVLKKPILNESKKITDYKYYINELPIISTLIKAIQEQQEVIENLINKKEEN